MRFSIFILSLLVIGPCLGNDQAVVVESVVIGSCAQQSRPQPFWPVLQGENPELFLFVGDNVYATDLPYRKLRRQYHRLAKVPGFASFREQTTIMAIWDDHDYGLNDGGAEYKRKQKSKKAFLKFFNPPKSTRVWRGEGLYRQRIFGPPGKRVQVIMLDTRYFRSPLNALPKAEQGSHGRYLPDNDTQKTMLGHAQWHWLEGVLKKPAELRLIITSIQAIPNAHQWEKWGNFPHERRRLFSLIKNTNAQGVVLISGDRHMGEISKLPGQAPDGVGYPLFELTSSGLNTNMASSEVEANPHRVGKRHRVNHYGLVRIQWQDDPLLHLQIKDTEGNPLDQVVTVRLSQLK